MQEAWESEFDSCLEKTPGGGHGEPMERGAWGAPALGVTKSQTRLQ